MVLVVVVVVVVVLVAMVVVVVVVVGGGGGRTWAPSRIGITSSIVAFDTTTSSHIAPVVPFTTARSAKFVSARAGAATAVAAAARPPKRRKPRRATAAVARSGLQPTHRQPRPRYGSGGG